MNDGFLLNQLNVAAAVTFAGASGTTFTSNGPILPQINQNSANAVTFIGPINLAAMTILSCPGGAQVMIPNRI